LYVQALQSGESAYGCGDGAGHAGIGSNRPESKKEKSVRKVREVRKVKKVRSQKKQKSQKSQKSRQPGSVTVDGGVEGHYKQ